VIIAKRLNLANARVTSFEPVTTNHPASYHLDMRYLVLPVLATALLLATSCAKHVPPSVTNGTPVQISQAGQRAAEPAIATGANGTIYMVYVEHHGGDGADVLLQAIGSNGAPIGEHVRVNDVPDAAKSWRGDPPTIALSQDGTVFVGWTRKYADPSASGNDLMLSVSSDGGRTFAAPVKVNDDTVPAAHGMHSLAVDGSGRVIMAWLDERNVTGKPHEMNMSGGQMHHDEGEPNSEVFTAMSTDGGRTFSPNRKISADACPCCKTSLLAAADGTVYAAWRQVLEGDHRHIALASSHDGGVTFTPGVIVSNDNWQLSACPVSGAALASRENGEVELTWYTEGAAGPPGLYFTHSHDGGKTFSDRELMSDQAKSGTPALAGNTCVFNSKDGGVRAQTVSEERQAENAVAIADASLPAAASSVGKTIVAFVRAAGDSSSVWVEVLG
jgi:hypothetical protein